MFISAIFFTGLSGIVAQVLLLRELLVSFYGNELTLGLILANWLVSEALGVFYIGKYIDRIKNRIGVFVILQTIFSLMLFISIYLSRIFKNILGIPSAEALGLYTVFWVSFFIVLPVAFCHGALFSAGCKIYSLSSKRTTFSIGRVYTWETIGTIIGGIIITYLFIPYFDSFQIVFIIGAVNFISCFFILSRPKTLPFRARMDNGRSSIPPWGTLGFTPRGSILKLSENRILKYGSLAAIFLMLFLFLSGGLKYIQRFSIEKQWRGVEVLDYRNSVYGNIVVGKREKQTTFFYNGIPVITTPYPDITFVQEFGNLPLLFHRAPQDILVVGGGAGGLINEILKHPVRAIDYAELDFLIIKMLQKYNSELTQKELNDSRVRIINQDGRFFVKNTSRQYDIVIIGLSKPSDLFTNRLFTKEFFLLVKNRLKPSGILAFWLPGSLTYLSAELRDLNACILKGLADIYGYIRIIPGDYNIFLASVDKDMLGVNSDLLVQRIKQRDINTDLLLPAYLRYRLNSRWLAWFERSLIGATEKVNQDTRPYAVFEMLVFWNRQFSPVFSKYAKLLGDLDLRGIFMPLLILTFLLFYIFNRKPVLSKFNIVYSIATTGFFGMMINLILIFSFQVFYGYLYRMIGILISIFMIGIAFGSIFITKRIERIKNPFRLFVALEVSMVLFSFITAFITSGWTNYMFNYYLIFIVLFIITGLIMGLDFPLASKMYLKDREGIGNTAGLLYGADLLGGWLAGILGGMVLLPVLGLFNSCIVIVLFKLSSLILLFSFKQQIQT